MSREALIVAHGQPSAPVPPELWLMGFAKAVQDHLPGWNIRAATLAMPGALERQASEIAEGSQVFPMFMADGWFVGKVLPKRLNGAPLTILPPLGFDQNLPDFAANTVRDALANRGWREPESHLLVAAHGSARGPKAAESAQAFRDALSKRFESLKITVGFVEEAPFIEQAARGLPRQTLCLPFFALEGDHCREDIPEGLEKAAFSGDLLAPLGSWPQVAQMVAHSLKTAR
ncbi:CbiX/SirB N-terminal domain-containing protein [Shimia sp.]|uniref:CbiX/SirB N-terminal domain-containing protein n=1 Tax=Shimia sp. TaxID=1954381 RepID=UPI003B8AC9B7